MRIVPALGLPEANLLNRIGPPVTDSPARTRRRNRSVQRERMLEWLRATDAHPTAAEIHAALLPGAPHLSLGTVYRNLEVLIADGRVEAVSGAGAALRYDANPLPHHHFVCDRCGRIRDLPGSGPRGLSRRLE